MWGLLQVQFVRGPRATWDHLQAALRRREPRHIGHNPLGACMVMGLLACVAGLGLSGWLYTTGAFRGDARVEAVHVGLAWMLLGLASLHVAGVFCTGWRRRQSLLLAMFSGRKRGGD